MITVPSINTKENELIETLNLFTEWEDKYNYIIEYENKGQLFEKSLQKDENFVKGCQSKVWLYAKVVDNKYQYYSFSDTPIPKGLAAMLCYLYSGNTSSEIQSFEPQLFIKTDLINYLSPLRQRGVKAMLHRFKELAKTK